MFAKFKELNGIELSKTYDIQGIFNIIISLLCNCVLIWSARLLIKFSCYIHNVVSHIMMLMCACMSELD